MKVDYSRPSDDPYAILGVDRQAGSDAIRAAYLEKVKAFPPDRFPEAFEKIRDAYQTLRDPRQRIRALLEARPPTFSDVLGDEPPERRFVGPRPWLAAMRERKP